MTGNDSIHNSYTISTFTTQRTITSYFSSIANNLIITCLKLTLQTLWPLLTIFETLTNYSTYQFMIDTLQNVQHVNTFLFMKLFSLKKHFCSLIFTVSFFDFFLRKLTISSVIPFKMCLLFSFDIFWFQK